MKPFRCSAIAFSMLTLLVALSGCRDAGLEQTEPRLRVEAEVVDFGAIRVGAAEERRIEMANVGTGGLVLGEIGVHGDGRAEWFDVSPGSLEVAVGREGHLSVTFEPTDEGNAEALLRISSNDKDDPVREIRLRGRGYIPDVVLERNEIDFGTVVVETVSRETIRLDNRSDRPALVRVRSITGSGSAQFLAEGPDAEDAFTIAPGASQDIGVTYAPTSTGTHFAFFIVEPCEGCASEQIALLGEAIDSGLVVTPTTIDFGMARPEASLSREVVFRNVGNVDLQILDLAYSSPNDGGAPSGAFGLLHSSLPIHLSVGEEVRVEAVFTPPEVGLYEVRLDWASTDRKNDQGYLLLMGRGGAPWIRPSSEAIEFPLTAVGFSSSATLRIGNIGQEDLIIHQVDTEEGAPFRVIEGEVGPIRPGEEASLPVAFEPSEAGSFTGTLVIRSNDPHDPAYEIELTGEAIRLDPCVLSIDPESLDFGAVDQGEQRQRQVILRNEGEPGERCLVATVVLGASAGDAFWFVDGPVRGGLILDGGQQRELTVAFRPPSVGTYETFIEVFINDPEEPRRTVPLTGASYEPGLLILPESVDFGSLAPGCGSRARQMCAHNIGDETLTLRSIDLSSWTPSPVFALESLPEGLEQPGITMAPGARVCFDVRFEPQGEGRFEGHVSIEVDGVASPYLSAIAGTGDLDPTQTEVFDQTGRPEVDILFVLDETGAVPLYHARLADNVPLFMDFAYEHGVDYQIGVVGTNRFTPGILRPTSRVRPHIVHPGLEDPAGTLQQNLEVEWLNADHIRMAFFNAEAALHPSSLNDPEKSYGLIRPDAHLSLIFLSPVDEQSQDYCGMSTSSDLGCGTVDYFWRAFAEVKGFRRPELLSAHGLISLDASCGELGPHQRYLEMIDRTGGHAFSICAADWGEQLGEMMASVFGYRRVFELANTPDPDAGVSVYILREGGERVPGQLWEYDPVKNAIVFDPLAIPEGGDQVEVTFTAVCGS